MRGRYAPSPTGYLHLGNARTALLTWLSVRKQGGKFVLRIEDIDEQRSNPKMIAANIEELRWLSLDWDEGPYIGGKFAPYLQSERKEHYCLALEQLRAKNCIFTCYLSRKDLRTVAAAPHGQLVVYGELERKHNENIKKQGVNKAPSLRFYVPDKTIYFTDLFVGEQEISLRGQVGDFVLKRADGMWAYHLAVVVDDVAMDINYVLRGDDLLTSTGAQLALYEALGKTPPKYVHVPLLLDLEGKRMAKRRGSLTLTALREYGIRPERVVGFLAHSLGLASKKQELSAKELIANFKLSRLHSYPYQITQDDLDWLLARAHPCQ